MQLRTVAFSSFACLLCKCGKMHCTGESTMHTNPGLRKGAWTEEEDILLRKYIEKYGEGKWHQVAASAGLNRCRKSCRLRWLNYLRPDIKRGDFAFDEVDLIIRLHKLLGNRWSLIAGRLPGRTPNDVKNYWNTHLQKKITARRELEEGKASNGRNTKILAKASNVVKPRPWTFRKNASLLREKTTNAETTALTKDGSIKDSSPTSQPTEKENMLWWDNLFLDEEIREGTTWSLHVGGSREDHLTSLWSDELSQLGVEEGGNWAHENQDGSGYFSVDAAMEPNF